MRKVLFPLSILLNLAFVAIFWFMIDRLGGPNFAWHRFKNDQVVGTYVHRRGLFEKLPVQKGDIVFLGDSNTQENEWREMLGDSLPIRNRGIVGDGVTGVLARLDKILAGQPSKIFLMIGTNDLLFGMKTEDAMWGYRQILDRVKKNAPETQLILQSILPVNNSTQSTTTDNEKVEKLNAEIEKEARARGLVFLNISSKMKNSTGDLDPRFSGDGVHLNAAGYEKWAAELAPFLR